MQTPNTPATTLHNLIREALNMSTRPAARRTLVAALVVFALSSCSSQSSTAAAGAAGAAPTRAASAAAPEVPAAAVDLGGRALPDFASLVERYGPAVVNVTTVQRRQRAADIPGLSPDDPFYEFFRRFQGPRGNQPAPRGEGSGFIVSADGYILTNAHVVDEASEVTVKLTDRREYSAKVIGLDKRTDVAVLKIEAANLPTVRLGDPAKLRPGEWVIAIGSPFGFDNSVTAGIVSAKSRSLPGEDSNYVPFIQTDVAARVVTWACRSRSRSTSRTTSRTSSSRPARSAAAASASASRTSTRSSPRASASTGRGAHWWARSTTKVRRRAVA
jgi:serine protease Do